jgi:hypothetical protein
MSIKLLDKVICHAGDIDAGRFAGLTGTVDGFARLSAYHAREAYVRFADGKSGWFWERDLTVVEDEAPARVIVPACWPFSGTNFEVWRGDRCVLSTNDRDEAYAAAK